MKQYSLFSQPKVALEYGGTLQKGKRKESRPLSTKKTLHLVFRSDLALGKFKLTQYKEYIVAKLENTAQSFHIKVYKFSINSNHIHLAILGNTKDDIIAFLRVFPGLIAKHILKKMPKRPKKFWTLSVFSRIVYWGRAFKVLIKYIEQNQKESSGEIAYQPRGKPKPKSSNRTL